MSPNSSGRNVVPGWSAPAEPSRRTARHRERTNRRIKSPSGTTRWTFLCDDAHTFGWTVWAFSVSFGGRIESFLTRRVADGEKVLRATPSGPFLPSHLTNIVLWTRSILVLQDNLQVNVEHLNSIPREVLKFAAPQSLFEQELRELKTPPPS